MMCVHFSSETFYRTAGPTLRTPLSGTCLWRKYVVNHCLEFARGLHIRLGIEIMVWDGRHPLCAVHVVNDMQYMCSIRLLRCVLCWYSTFFEHVVLRSCTANCGTSSIFMSQMAVGFWNTIRTDASLGVLIINIILFFTLLSCFKQCVLGLSGLNVIILPFAWRSSPPPPPFFFFFFS